MFTAIIHYTYVDGEDPDLGGAHHYRDTFRSFYDTMSYANRIIGNLEGHGERLASLFVYRT